MNQDAPATPHGHCYICGGLLPPERQDQGGKQCCSSTCRHLEAVYKGSANQRHVHCVVCGKELEGQRYVTCSDHCAIILGRHRSRSRSRRTITEKNTATSVPQPRICVVCDTATVGGRKHCSDECRDYDKRANPKDGNKTYRNLIRAADFDDFHPTESQREHLWDMAVRKGIISIEYEVEHIFIEASALRGVPDHELAIILHTDGPDWAVALKNLGCSRRLKQAFESVETLLKNDEENLA
jgi:predicted nucleic acid-binding Zn ribbon protein